MTKLITFATLALAAVPAFAEQGAQVPVPAALSLLGIGALAALGVKLFKK